jgi:hypothetical protein
MGLDVTVDISGPIWDGTAQIEVEHYCRHLEEVIGADGVTRIRHYLPTQYMYLGHHGGTPKFNPIPPNAGALQAAIHTERQVKDALIVTDDPVTYGAWIEGVDALNLVVWHHYRNPPPRRFPGYHTFRIITQILNSEAEVIALRELPPYLRAMNA